MQRGWLFPALAVPAGEPSLESRPFSSQGEPLAAKITLLAFGLPLLGAGPAPLLTPPFQSLGGFCSEVVKSFLNLGFYIFNVLFQKEDMLVKSKNTEVNNRERNFL